MSNNASVQKDGFIGKFISVKGVKEGTLGVIFDSISGAPGVMVRKETNGDFSTAETTVYDVSDYTIGDETKRDDGTDEDTRLCIKENGDRDIICVQYIWKGSLIIDYTKENPRLFIREKPGQEPKHIIELPSENDIDETIVVEGKKIREEERVSV